MINKRPPYEKVENFLNYERNPVSYDFKNEDPCREVREESNPIKKFLRYQISNSKFDCDSCELARSIYKNLWEDDFFDTKGSDTMNSFWITYRQALELYFEQLFTSEENLEKFNKHKYNFVLYFGGTRSGFVSKLGINKKALNDYFNENEKTVSPYYMESLRNGYNNKYDKEYDRERLRWLLDNFDEFDKVNHNDDIHEFAMWTHTIGNFSIVPKGFNTGRYRKTNDYWDLSLSALQECDTWNTWHHWFNGKASGKSRTEFYFLEEYFSNYSSELNLKELKVNLFFANHSLKQMRPLNWKELIICVRSINRLIENRSIRMLKELNINNAIISTY